MKKILNVFKRWPQLIVFPLVAIMFLFEKLLESNFFPELYIKNTVLIIIALAFFVLFMMRRKYKNWVKLNYTQAVAEIIEVVDMGYKKEVKTTLTSVSFSSQKQASLAKIKFIDPKTNKFVEQVLKTPIPFPRIGKKVDIYFKESFEEYDLISNSLFLNHGETLIYIFGFFLAWVINFSWKL